MAEASDTTLAFFTKATPSQWRHVLSLYKEVLKQKAALRASKKGGPEELIKLDVWYQEQLPKVIRARKDMHLLHDELVKVMKWKLMRGKYRPQLLDLVKINTELAVKSTSKKAFRKLPNLSSAITALTNLKGIGPATASAILAAAFPDQAPYMADESMLSTPGVEATDYTLAEYINYAERIKTCTDQLAQKDPEGTWTPHKVELVLWAHYVARELKPSLLDDLNKYKDGSTPPATPNGNSCIAADSNGGSHDDTTTPSANDRPGSSSDSRSSAEDESSSQDAPDNGALGSAAEEESSDVSSSKGGGKRELDDEEGSREGDSESTKKKLCA
ncbi:uncharacterized protein LOC135391526 [Ornithodoros turicata]|uniref:uncharacterized protein LOC135391526 n=1 Tax=Ornithodoros turicata TaxID=34597 RepID=UPI00313896C9